MSNTIVNIDLEKQTAMLVMPVLSMVAPDTKVLGETVAHFSSLEDAIIEVDGLSITISMNVDFGDFIPKTLWTFFEGGLWDMVHDMGGIPRELREQQEEAILKHVKRAYPKVEKIFKDFASGVIEEWNATSELEYGI